VPADFVALREKVGLLLSIALTNKFVSATQPIPFCDAN
jgi:hypothetical protein